jgi:hypothetical protein
MSRPVVIAACLAPPEFQAAEAALARLGEVLAEAAGQAPQVALHALESPAEAAALAPTAILLSLHPVRPAAPWEAAAAALTAQVEATTAATEARVVLCTLFRHVRRGPQEAALRERIRRLNRLAIELAHTTGAAVADIDRACAHVGARALGADYRLDSRLAQEVAGEAIAAALLAEALDGHHAERVLQKARRLLGLPGARAAAEAAGA